MVQLVQGIVDTQKHICRSLGRANAGDDLKLELEVKMNGQPITFVNPTCELLIKKSDNNKVRQTKDIIYQDGKIKIKVDQQGVTCPGTVINQLIINDEGRVSTCLFYFMVGTSLDREVLQSISKVEVLEQLDEYVVAAFSNLDEYEKRILSSDETIRKLNSDINEAEKNRDAAEQKREEFKLLLESKLENGEFIGATGKQGPQGIQGERGPQGEQGPKGETGPQGPIGEQGPQGLPGKDGKNGLDGTNGQDGVTPKIQVGTVTTLEAGQQATVVNSGTKENPIFDFAIPRGENGADGITPDMTEFKNQINKQCNAIFNENNNFKNEMKESYGNAKADYFGKEHNNIVDRLNSDFDNVHQRINDSSYLLHEGSNITANNSYYGYTKELSVKGRTLHNLITKYNEDGKVFNVSNGLITVNAGVGSSYRFFSPLNNGMLKPNTKYTLIVDIIENTLDGTQVEINYPQLNGNDYGNCIKDSIFLPFGSVGKIVKVVTSKEDVVNQKYLISPRLTPGQTSGILKMYLTILEGDYTDTSIEEMPFIERIKSACETDVTEDGKYPVNIKSCGKNLFHSELELGGVLSHNGLLQTSDAFIRCKDFIYIPVNFRNKSFKLSTNIPKFNTKEGTVICFYDYNKQYISGDNHAAIVKIPYNACYLKFRLRKHDSSIVTDDELSTILIQIEQGTIATDYEPHQESIQKLLLDEPLMSLPNGVCDEILEDGTEIRRVVKCVLNDAELRWASNSDFNGTDVLFFYINTANNPTIPEGKVKQNTSINCYCDKFPSDMVTNRVYNKNNNIESVFYSDSNNPLIQFFIKKSRLETENVNGFQKWLQANPITIYYELAEPIIKKHNKNINLKTYAGTTHIVSTNVLPATINCKVPSNVQAVISNLKEENKALNTQVSTLNLENADIKETNANQDELINTTMMATDQMYMMLEPLLANILVNGEAISPLVNMYVAMIKRGLKTIDQIPEKWREQVKKILDQLEK